MVKKLPRSWPANDRCGEDDITRQEYIHAMIAAGYEYSWLPGFWKIRGTDICVSESCAGYKFKDKIEYMREHMEKEMSRLNLAKKS